MKFLIRFLQFLLWLIVATWVGRKLFGWLAGNATSSARQPIAPTSNKIPLHRDPFCGMFISAEISKTLEQSGRVYHFCSTECRERWKIQQRQAASA